MSEQWTPERIGESRSYWSQFPNEHSARLIVSLFDVIESQRAELEAVRDYLDRCIIHWRAHRDEPTDAMQPFAHYYVDAFQSVRTSIFGETLPATSRADPGATSGEDAE